MDLDNLDHLSLEDKKRLVELLQEKEDRVRFNKATQFNPYGWQLEFINASKDNRQLLAMTGNRCGKTYTGAHIMSYHLTGRYPDWWKGHRFDRPINAWASGVSNVTTRDILQSELLGSWTDPTAFGTGAIPKDAIVDTVNRVGLPGGVEAVIVKHISGGYSQLMFKSYEMGQDKYMGTAIDLVWLDEECPNDIFTQCITRTATTNGIAYMTFTPEHGLTEIVNNFMHDLKPRQFMIQATWEDAPHLDEDTKEQLLAVYSPMERAMRASGQPSLGSGVVFPIPEEKITVDPFTIPEHWLKIIGIDLGFDHPNAVANVAFDPDTGTYYLYDEYGESNETVPMHASAIRARGGNRIPVILPHDAFKHDSANSGLQFIQLYESEGINCIKQPFTNPPTPDGKSNGRSLEFGLHFMLTAMQKGKFKVFNTCKKFLQEMKTYHRKDGKVVDRKDDVISATRYAVLSVERFGIRGNATQNASYWSMDRNSLTPSCVRGIY